VRGSRRTLTEGSISRAVVLLAVPMVLEMVMESVFAVVDIFWVSRLGPQAVAAVGLTESLLTLIYTVAIGLSIGVTAMVARRVGEGDIDAAGRAAAQAVLLGLGTAAVLGLGGYLAAEALLRVMGGDAEVVGVGARYARLMLGGNVVILLLFLINAAFRGAGDAAVAMRVLWIANGVNLILDPLLIFGPGPFPELGVTGAATATLIGRGTGVAIQLAVLLRGLGRLNVRPAHWLPQPALMWRLIRLSASGTLQTFIGTASWIGLIRILAGFGSVAVAGYTIAIRIVLFALLPAWGMSNAAATLVGQNLGAGEPERAERSVWIAGALNLAFLGVAGVIFVAGAGPIVGAFTDHPETARMGTLALRTIAAGFFFYAYGMVLQQAFNGAGDTWTPTWINLVCFWLWEIPLAWALAHVWGLGPWGVHLAVTIAFSTLAVVAGLLFRRGRWKTVRV